MDHNQSHPILENYQQLNPNTTNVRNTPDKASVQSSWINRYKDAYRVGKTIYLFGSTVKVIGVIFAIFVCLISLLMGFATLAVGEASQYLLPLGILIGFIGIIFGVFIGALLFVFGTLISAQGQLLIATLDSAVYASPFMLPESKVAAMS